MGPAVPISKGYVRDRPHLYQRNIRYMYGSGRTYLKKICKRPAAPISKEYSILCMGPAIPISKGYVRDRPHLYQRNIRFYAWVRPYLSQNDMLETGRTYIKGIFDFMHGSGRTYLKGICKRPAAPISKEYSIYPWVRPYLSQNDMLETGRTYIKGIFDFIHGSGRTYLKRIC